MSPGRTFGSIDGNLASVNRHDSVIMSERSEANAKDVTQSYSKDSINPITSDSKSRPKAGITFAAQEKLPKLPIPDLEVTCQRFLTAADPLQTAREHKDSQRAVEEFLKGEGPTLQEKLKKYATGQTSYIEQFCELHALSEYRRTS